MNRNSFCDKSNALLKNAENRTITNELLMSYGIIVYPLKMPMKIKGYTHKFEEVYIVFINSDYCEECQWKPISHEINHIFNSDFSRLNSVEKIESDNPY